MTKTRMEPDFRTLEDAVEYVRLKGIAALEASEQGRIEVPVRLGFRELVSLLVAVRGLNDLTIDQFSAFVNQHNDEPRDVTHVFLLLARATVKCEAALVDCVESTNDV